MGKMINEKKKQEKGTSCQLKVHTVMITKEWTKILKYEYVYIVHYSNIADIMMSVEILKSI